MALKAVTDPNILAALNAPETPAATGPKPVTDPALLAQLNAPDAPPTPPSTMQQLEGAVPGSPEDATATAALPAPTAQEEPSLWDRVKNAVSGDPIIDMWMSGLPKVAKGLPETAMDMIGNAGVQTVAGLTAPLVGANDDDSADFIRDFTAENSMYPNPEHESAVDLTNALGEAFAPMQNIKSKLGDTTLDVTGSPLAATGADMLPDLGAALLGGPKAVRTAGELPKIPLKQEPVINPVVGNLRDADVRMRPSDVRAMTPGAKKVPGEFRERFADAPELKKDLTLHNAQKLTDIGAKEIGAKSLDDAAIAAAEKPAADVYNLVEDVLREHDMSPEFVATFREGLDSIKLELPRGKPLTVLGVLGKLRQRAAKRLQSDNPEMEAAGFADRNMADAIEEGLGGELTAAGESQVFDQYQGARELFGKIYDLRAATRAGQVDANVLYKIQKKTGKLTGGLKLIADAAEHAPNVTGHPLKTAARAGGEIESSKEGLIKSGIKKVARAIPGVDVGAERFQNTLGVPNPARAASYGKPSDVPPPRQPQQGGLDLREALDLNAPPGEVGVALPSFMRKKTAPEVQPDMLGEAFEFETPPGEVGIPPPEQISLQDLLGLGEPLAMTKPPGRVGKPKRKP